MKTVIFLKDGYNSSCDYLRRVTTATALYKHIILVRILRVKFDLINLHWKISVTAYPFSKERVHDCLTSRTNSYRLGKLRGSTFCHPSNLWGKASYMLFFGLQCSLRYEEGKVCVLNSKFLYLFIEPLLNHLPNEIRPWSKNITSGNVTIVNHFT